ncbi:MAG: Maf family protein, partial [Chitinophagaceae bacterium]
PQSKKEAYDSLRMLSGRMHHVVTGVCLKSFEKEVFFSDYTEVYFHEITPEQIENYIEKCKPFDKAGSYGIQEWIGMIGIEKINGNFFNVMGLPINLVIRALEKF